MAFPERHGQQLCLSMGDPSMKLLILGGSGFVSGTLARLAVSEGHEVHVVTRGRQRLPDGVTAIKADRKDREGFAKAVRGAGVTWDLVADCIGFEPGDARQDIAVFRDLTPHLVFLSTDFVFDPAHRRFPQGEEADRYVSDGYGGNKRLCELELLSGDTGSMAWTILRPCHIYGPGSKLGCLPLHSRDDQVLDRIRKGETLRLVGGGHFLQQPIFARDLCALILSCRGNSKVKSGIFCCAGPDIIESRDYYILIADALGLAHPPVEEVPVQKHLAGNPGDAPFLCHRVYNLDRLRATGAAVPATPIAEGIRHHVASLQ
jgi:nucleoside-diphosphate-sugar epimerase